jgi:hypothetical protein
LKRAETGSFGRALGSGLVRLEIVVSADEAELVLKAIQETRQRLAPARESGPRPSAADAIVHMAALQLTGVEASPGVSASDRCQVVIHVDHELAASDGMLRAELEDGTHVSAETLRRVSCDGASSRRFSIRRATFSTLDDARARYRPPFDALSGFVTRDAASLAVQTSDFSTDITSSTGCTAVVRRSTTWSCSVRSITGRFTRAASRSD